MDSLCVVPVNYCSPIHDWWDHMSSLMFDDRNTGVLLACLLIVSVFVPKLACSLPHRAIVGLPTRPHPTISWYSHTTVQFRMQLFAIIGQIHVVLYIVWSEL